MQLQQRIRENIPNDVVLSKVRELLRLGRDPGMLDNETRRLLQPYLHVWDQLSLGNNLVFRADRVVLPACLISDAIDLSHQGHMGIVKSKQYLRNSLWFPNMDRLAEAKVRSCLACQASTPQMSALPAEPW